MHYVTVVDVARSMDVFPAKSLMWAVGRTVAAAYRTQTGISPTLERRQKTSGQGDHAFAVYPECWVTFIGTEIKRQHRDQASVTAAQPDLFG